MADGEGSTSKNDEIVKAAQNEIAQAMNKAMNNISNNSKDEATSNSLKDSSIVTEQDIEYVEPMKDPYNKAITYLENHNILQLFQVCIYVRTNKCIYLSLNLWFCFGAKIAGI
jgi:cob(I)alamin adenosyltransferase